MVGREAGGRPGESYVAVAVAGDPPPWVDYPLELIPSEIIFNLKSKLKITLTVSLQLTQCAPEPTEGISRCGQPTAPDQGR